MPADHGRRGLGWYWLVVGSFLLALAASTFFAFGPVYSSESSSAVPAIPAGDRCPADGCPMVVTESSDSKTLLEANGPGTSLLLAWPVLAAALAMVFPRRRSPRVLSSVLMAPLGVLVFSIGPFYWPAILTMLLAATAPSRDVEAPA